MEIPMKEIIDSYRQQLSDAIHKATLQEVHIIALKKDLEAKNKAIQDLQLIVDLYEHKEDPPQEDEWSQKDVNPS